MKPPEVIVFYAAMCDACHKVMDVLDGQGVAYAAHRVQWNADAGCWVDDEAGRLMVAMCGSPPDFVPQTFINGRRIKGWREFEPLVASGELARLLKGNGVTARALPIPIGSNEREN
jgi:glutaredoxin